jgi:hypothetical protein
MSKLRSGDFVERCSELCVCVCACVRLCDVTVCSDSAIFQRMLRSVWTELHVGFDLRLFDILPYTSEH